MNKEEKIWVTLINSCEYCQIWLVYLNCEDTFYLYTLDDEDVVVLEIHLIAGFEPTKQVSQYNAKAEVYCLPVYKGFICSKPL